MARVAVSTGKAATMSKLEANEVQQNTGMRIRFMPGARSLRIVVTKLTPVSSEPMPAICSAQR